MRRTLLSALGLVAALILVATAVPAGSPAAPVSMAGAQTAEECDVSTSSFLLGTVEGACNVDVPTQNNYEDAIDLYQDGLQATTQKDQWLDLFNNQLQTTEEVAWMRAERAVAAAASNGSTEAAANIDATETIKDYYTIHERNLVDKWNFYLTAFNTYRQSSINDTYDMFEFKEWRDSYRASGGGGYDPVTVDSVNVTGITSNNRTLINGSSMTEKQLEIDVTVTAHGGGAWQDESRTQSLTLGLGNASDSHTYTYDYDSLSSNTESPTPRITYHFNQIELQPPNSDYGPENFLWFEEWDRRDGDLTNQSSSMVNNSESFVSEVYPSLESGEIDPDDVISTVNEMFNYATQGGENATFTETVIALESLGLDPAGVNSSYLSLTYNHTQSSGNVTNDGMLLSETAPGGQWEVGKAYESSNVTGPQQVVTLDGEEHLINGTFEINSAHRNDGSEISSPDLSAPDNSYAVSNTTEAQQLITRLQEQINRFDNMTTDSGGAGGGSGGSGLGGLFGGLGDWFGGLFGGLATGVRRLAIVAVAVGVVILLVVAS